MQHHEEEEMMQLKGSMFYMVENISILITLELFYNNGIMMCDISYSEEWEKAQ